MVLDRVPREPRPEPRRRHRLQTPPGVDRVVGPRGRASHVPPLGLAVPPHPALVNVRHVGGDHALADGRIVRAQRGGGLADPALERAAGGWSPILSADDLRRSRQSDTVTIHQTYRVGLEPWAIAHMGCDPHGKRAPVGASAGAGDPALPILGHVDLRFRKLDLLPALTDYPPGQSHEQEMLMFSVGHVAEIDWSFLD